MKKISVIIPIYNVEEYLEKCLNSVINQTYKNLEIILIDDGSTDKSGEICDKYAKKDKRIIVIHKENSGVADARNRGLKIATGEYFGFVDSDDYIELDMFETLYNLQEKNNADISIVSFYEIYNEKIISVRDSGKFTEYTKTGALKELLMDRDIQSYVWNKLFKRELFEGIEFPTNKNYEDIAIMLLIFEKAEKTVLLQEPKYYYQRRDNSITGIKNYKTYKDKLDVAYNKFMYLDGKYKELDLYNAYNYAINALNIYCITATYNVYKLEKDFEEPCKLLVSLINKYGNKLIALLNDFDKAILFMLLLGKEQSKPAVKSLYTTYKAIKK